MNKEDLNQKSEILSSVMILLFISLVPIWLHGTTYNPSLVIIARAEAINVAHFGIQ